jgi:hypothetical protein
MFGAAAAAPNIHKILSRSEQLQKRRNMKRTLVLIILALILGIAGYFALNALQGSPPGTSIILNVQSTPTTTIVSGPVILEAIKNQAQLETVSMVVANDQDVTRVWGLEGVCQEKVTYLGYFLITAGVELQNITTSDIQVVNGASPQQTSITITLAPASILHVELDTRNSRVVHHEQSIISQLCGTQLPEMVMEAQLATQQMAAGTALEEDIINMAQARAGFELQKMLMSFGFSNTIILYR